MKDLLIVDIDYSGVKPEFKKVDNIIVKDMAGPFIVPEEGPFYETSIRLRSGGTLLQPDTDYEFLSPVSDLTEMTGKGISLYLKVKPHVLLAKELELTYQKVGNPIISRKKLLDLLQDLIIDGKPIDWNTQIEGMPDTFYPAWHSMDIQNPNEMVGFGNMMQLFMILSVKESKESGQVNTLMEQLETNIYKQLDYTQKLNWGFLMSHVRNYRNPHGVVASDVELGNVKNAGTATPQQDSEGMRQDLYSTPAGLKRLLDESEPDSELFLMQNEVPFSYYGSGIYLPPPITGSFEGLGGDYENGAFCLEGNGWTVGLFHCMDGRVRNLYYVYNETYPTNDMVMTSWRHTYVQYQHPVITAAGCTPIVVLSGSNHELLCIGDNTRHRYWVAAANSTFNPDSHDMKELDLADIANRPTWYDSIWMSGNIFRVGDWCYIMMFNSEITEPAGTWGNPAEVYPDNASAWMYRFSWNDLINPNIRTLKPLRVNVTFDNLFRERRVNAQAFSMSSVKHNAQNQVVGYMGLNFLQPISWVTSHRRRSIAVMANPNDPTKARLRCIFIVHAVTVNNGSPVATSDEMCGWWDFDTTTNTLALDPRWTNPNFDILAGAQLQGNGISGWTKEQKDYFYANAGTGGKGGDAGGSTMACVSLVPGYGTMTMCSGQDGGSPYYVNHIMSNLSRDPKTDWEWWNGPLNRDLPNGRSNCNQGYIEMLSPFGVSAYPRWSADVYEVNGVIRDYPTEVFLAMSGDPGHPSKAFYREAESGSGADYVARPELMSPILGQLTGRKSNSRFGPVSYGFSPWTSYVNSPMEKNIHSRQLGMYSLFDLKRLQSDRATWFSNVLRSDGNIAGIKEESDGSIRVPLIGNYTILNGKMTIRASPARSVQIPKSIWETMWKNMIGAVELAKAIDVIVDVYVSSRSGNNTTETPPSFMMVNYHTTDNPSNVKQIVAMFYWEENGRTSDNCPIMKVVNVSYPFTSAETGDALSPTGGRNYFPLGQSNVVLNQDGTWTYIGTGTALSSDNVQIMKINGEGPAAWEMRMYPGWRWMTSGYSRIPNLVYSHRNGALVKAISLSPYTGAFVSYGTYELPIPGIGWCIGLSYLTSGGAMNVLYKDGTSTRVMLQATYVEGNWALFITTPVTTTFNGRAITATPRAMDVRDFAQDYKNQKFYLYCVSRGTTAEYELTKTLRNTTGDAILVGIITTDALGITNIERRQQFLIAGFPLTRTRDAGIPVSSGGLLERGNYKFLKQSELYNG